MKKRNIPFSPPDMTIEEADAVRDTILSGWITTGPKTKEFERQIAAFLGTSKAVCLNSQTASGEMALRLLGIEPGDEVIVPAYTYTASASIVCHMGAKLVFVDAQKDCVEMDYDAMEAAITERTKAIIPVDLYGMPCDYDRIFDIVERKKNLFHANNEIQDIIGRIAICADCAHAFGASRQGKMVGTIADFSSFSFHAVKNLTTAEGGSLTWNLPNVKLKNGEMLDDYLYRMSMLYSLHGQSKDAFTKNQHGGWEYDIMGPWYKCNMTDIMASIGLVQLKRYPGILERRRKIIEKYDTAFKPTGIKVLNHYCNEWDSSGHLYITRIPGLTLETRQDIMTKMSERGITTNVHYKPLPMMTGYKNLGFDIKDFPNAYNLFVNEITLPLHTKLTDEDVDYIIENFCEIVKDVLENNK